jgi:DNA-binding MarR family transcriptional regulator
MEERGTDRRPLGLLLAQVAGVAARRFFSSVEHQPTLLPRQIDLLGLVEGSDGVSQRALAERMGVPPSRMVALVDELEAAGLVERRRSAVDRRSNAVVLTDAGRASLARSVAGFERARDEVFGALTPGEQETLRALLARVADAHGIGPDDLPFGGGPGRRGRGSGWSTPWGSGPPPWIRRDRC